MIHEELLKKSELIRQQENLLESIAEVKKLHRARIILLKNQTKSLNDIAEEVCDASFDGLKILNMKVKRLRNKLLY